MSSNEQPPCHRPRAIILTDSARGFESVRAHLAVAALRVTTLSDVDRIRGLDPGGWKLYLGPFRDLQARGQLVRILMEAGFGEPEHPRGA